MIRAGVIPDSWNPTSTPSSAEEWFRRGHARGEAELACQELQELLAREGGLLCRWRVLAASRARASP